MGTQIKNVFSRNLRKLREFNEMTQREAADKCSIGLTSYQAYEVGTEPAYEVLLRIIKTFKIGNVESFLLDPDFLERKPDEDEAPGTPQSPILDTDHTKESKRLVLRYFRAEEKIKRAIDTLLELI